MTQPPHVPSAPNPAWEFVIGPPDLTLPEFPEITPDHLVDAAGRAVRHAQDGVAEILASAEDPSFHTVTLALERALQPADALSALVRVFESNVQTDAVAESAAAAAAATANTTEARETARRSARTHAKGLWGTPAESLRGVSNFNPTGFRG